MERVEKTGRVRICVNNTILKTSSKIIQESLAFWPARTRWLQTSQKWSGELYIFQDHAIGNIFFIVVPLMYCNEYRIDLIKSVIWVVLRTTMHQRAPNDPSSPKALESHVSCFWKFVKYSPFILQIITNKENFFQRLLLRKFNFLKILYIKKKKNLSREFTNCFHLFEDPSWTTAVPKTTHFYPSEPKGVKSTDVRNVWGDNLLKKTHIPSLTFSVAKIFS